MCNITYNIKSTTKYLEQFTGIEIKTAVTPKADVEKLPLAISGNYCFHDIEMFDTTITLVIPNIINECSPIQLAKHHTKMTEAFRHPVVFVLDGIKSYNITRLSRARVDFLVTGKIVFIPSMMMVLRNIKDTVNEIPDRMPPVAQLLILYHIEVEGLDGKSTATIATATGLAYPTINVALKWLAKKDIVKMVGGKEKQVMFCLNGKMLWDKVLPLMTSPVERIVFTDIPITDSLYSGETAMGHYTMLAEPTVSVVAISKNSAKINSRLLNKHYGNIKTEIWKYDPTILSNNNCVDPLSLYLCMKDNKDERIQIECDTLIEEMKW